MFKFLERRTRFYPEGKASIDEHLNDSVTACSSLLSHHVGQDALCSHPGSGSKKANSSVGLFKVFQKVKWLLYFVVTILKLFIKRTLLWKQMTFTSSCLFWYILEKEVLLPAADGSLRCVTN